MATKRLGFLLAENDTDWGDYITAFEGEITRLGTDVAITYMPLRPNGAGGKINEIRNAATYLASNSDVIVTAGTAAALALKQATEATLTPFVYASVGDPGLSGLMPRPGGNFTGGTNQQVAMVKDRVDHMRNNAAFREKFAVAGNYSNEPARTAMLLACNLLGGAYPAAIAPGDDIKGFVANLKNIGIRSLYVCSDLYLTANAKLLNQQCHAGPAASKINTMWEFAEHVNKHDGDDFHGLSFQDLFKKAAGYVDQIVTAGKMAGDLPLFTTTVLGVRTAKAGAKKGGGKPQAKKGAARKKKR